MDTRILKHYERELEHIRGMGAEFAEAYPKVASRLGLTETEVIDPYVERLVESFAFFAARVQLSLELQYPVFTRHLLEIVYPHFLAPTPSMMIAEFEPSPALAAMPGGYLLERHTALHSNVEDAKTPCIYRTSRELRLWPLRVTEAEYIDGRGELQKKGFDLPSEIRQRRLRRDQDPEDPPEAAIRLRVSRIGAGPIAEVAPDSLTLFLKGGNGANWFLHELLATQGGAIAASSGDGASPCLLDGDVRPIGFSPAEALLPNPRRSFDGYRILQEYMAMPERFHFVELTGLAPAFQVAQGGHVDLVLYLRNGRDGARDRVDPARFSLHATPAVNLFPKRCDRAAVRAGEIEHAVYPKASAKFDFEVYSIESAKGVDNNGRTVTDFKPFYSQGAMSGAGRDPKAFFTQKRRMRRRPESARLKGQLSDYLGSDLWMTLVDGDEAPRKADIAELSVMAMCTNRDLPNMLNVSRPGLFRLPNGGPVGEIRTPTPPTSPRPSMADDGAAWRLISHLSLNYLSFSDTEGGAAADALREMVRLYAAPGDTVAAKQVDGILSVAPRHIVRRMPDEILSTPVRGVEITLTMDESRFEGASPIVLAGALNAFFQRYVSINSFVETVLRSPQRDEVMRWDRMTGLNPIL